MDQLFGLRLARPLAEAQVYPAINLSEDDDNLYVEAEIPGMELGAFELFVNDDNQLTLQGERKRLGSDEGTRHREERGFGRFSRMITLPAPVDGEATSADYVAGVLRITLPKKPEAKPRRIAVKAG
jgi:HSP20 family protein